MLVFASSKTKVASNKIEVSTPTMKIFGRLTPRGGVANSNATVANETIKVSTTILADNRVETSISLLAERQNLDFDPDYGVLRRIIIPAGNGALRPRSPLAPVASPLPG